jgi:hypothetical protein
MLSHNGQSLPQSSVIEHKICIGSPTRLLTRHAGHAPKRIAAQQIT